MANKIKADMNFITECTVLFHQFTVRRKLGRAPNKGGFTLVELIVVTAILGVLASMAIPAYNGYITSTRNAASASDIRNIEKAISAYLLDKNTTTPAATLAAMGIADKEDPWKHNYVYILHDNIVDATGALRNNLGIEDLNEDYDIYSMGVNGVTALDPTVDETITNDDIVRVGNGGFVGVRK